MRLAAACAVIALMAVVAGADTKPSAQEEHGARWKQKRIDQLDGQRKELESEASRFKRSRQFAESNRVEKEIKYLKKQILDVKKMTLEEAFEEYEKEQFDLAEEKRKKSEATAKAIAEMARKANNTTRPLAILAMGIVDDVIGVPQLVVEVENDCAQAIEAFTVEAELFNKFGEAVSFGINENKFRGIDQDKLDAGKTRMCRWSLVLHRTATRADIWIARIKFADGSEWTQDKETAKSRQGNFAVAKKAS